MKQTYIIKYSSAHWCGAASHCLVDATSEAEAEDLASDFMYSDMYETYYDPRDVDEDEDGEYYDETLHGDAAGDYTVHSVELLSESDSLKYAQEPTQAQFYPKVN